MSLKMICDVCREQLSIVEWERDPGITVIVPAAMAGDLPELEDCTYHVCSWDCMMGLPAVALEEQEYDDDANTLGNLKPMRKPVKQDDPGPDPGITIEREGEVNMSLADFLASEDGQSQMRR